MQIDQNIQNSWNKLNEEIKTWWDTDLHIANEEQVRNDGGETLLYLPHPYSSAGGSENAFPEMYGWDTYFINIALLEHGRHDIVRNHIINQLFMIERYGMVLNGSRNYYLTRSQCPLLSESIVRYHKSHPDRDTLCIAYPLLKKEYNDYWNATHHMTPTGLATNRDLGDPNWRPELAAEAEIYDFTPCFDGDVRKCNPIMTNSALVQYARNLSYIAKELGWNEESTLWNAKAEERADLIRKYCWDDEKGFFFDYQFERGERLPYYSVFAYWTMWAKVATDEQAAKMMKNLNKIEKQHGLSITAETYPSPHPEFQWLQFNHPAGWPPVQIMPIEGMDFYGYHEDAERICYKMIKMMLDQFGKTGKLWEKYNIEDGSLNLPKERYETVAMHGFISASFVVLGKRIFNP
jgi:alpha,alpha-trehalase